MGGKRRYRNQFWAHEPPSHSFPPIPNWSQCLQMGNERPVWGICWNGTKQRRDSAVKATSGIGAGV